MSEPGHPNGWRHLTLSEVAEVRLGRQRSPKNHSGDLMRPYLRAANVTWRGLSLDDVKEMNFTEAEMDTFRLIPGDVLVNEASGSPREVGKAAIFQGEIADCAFQNTLLRVRPYEGMGTPFLHLYLTYLALTGAHLEDARGVGIAHLGRAKLANRVIPVPPPAEQAQMVAVLEEQLSRLDATLASIKIVRAKADQFRRSLLHAAYTDGPSGPPEAWGTSGLGDVLSHSIGGVWGDPPSISEMDVDVIRVTELKQHGVIDPATAVCRSITERQFESRCLQAGDLLLEKSGGGPTSPVGRVGMVPSLTRPSVCSNFMMLMRPDEGQVLARFLHLYLVYFHAVGKTEPLQTASTNIRNIKTKEYLQIPIPLPSLVEQARIVSELEGHLSQLDATLAAADAAENRCHAMRRSLLHAAFTGKLTEEWRTSHG